MPSIIMKKGGKKAIHLVQVINYIPVNCIKIIQIVDTVRTHFERLNFSFVNAFVDTFVTTFVDALIDTIWRSVIYKFVKQNVQNAIIFQVKKNYIKVSHTESQIIIVKPKQRIDKLDFKFKYLKESRRSFPQEKESCNR